MDIHLIRLTMLNSAALAGGRFSDLHINQPPLFDFEGENCPEFFTCKQEYTVPSTSLHSIRSLHQMNAVQMSEVDRCCFSMLQVYGEASIIFPLLVGETFARKIKSFKNWWDYHWSAAVYLSVCLLGRFRGCLNTLELMMYSWILTKATYLLTY